LAHLDPSELRGTIEAKLADVLRRGWAVTLPGRNLRVYREKADDFTEHDHYDRAAIFSVPLPDETREALDRVRSEGAIPFTGDTAFPLVVPSRILRKAAAATLERERERGEWERRRADAPDGE